MGAGLWTLWQWRGPEGAFVPGLVGHGPDTFAWPRLFALWLPLGHVLFAGAHAWLGRRDPGGRLGRDFLLDQALSLVAALVMAVTLLDLRDPGGLRSVLGAYTCSSSPRRLRSCCTRPGSGWPSTLRAPGAPPSPSSSAAFLPYLLLGAHVVTAMSSTSDEPYYLLITHSLLHGGDLDLADDFARESYLPFYWGRLTTRTPGIRTTEDGRVYAEAFQGLQLRVAHARLLDGGRAGAVVVSISRARWRWPSRSAWPSCPARACAPRSWPGSERRFAADRQLRRLAVAGDDGRPLRDGRGLRGAPASAHAKGRRGDRALLAVMVATKTRLFLVAVPIMAGLIRQVRWRALAGFGILAGAAFVAMAAYDGLLQWGPVTRQLRRAAFPPRSDGC